MFQNRIGLEKKGIVKFYKMYIYSNKFIKSYIFFILTYNY